MVAPRLRVIFDALRCFTGTDLRRRLTRLSPALERRLIAHSGLGQGIVAGETSSPEVALSQRSKLGRPTSEMGGGFNRSLQHRA